MNFWKAVGSGLAGALTMNLLHESARQVVPHAPRLDVLGTRALLGALHKAGIEPPHGRNLRGVVLIGDVLFNTLLFSIVGARGRQEAVPVGALVGIGAGVATVTLAEPLGLGKQPGQSAPETQSLTMAWYLVGGLAAAGAYLLMARDSA